MFFSNLDGSGQFFFDKANTITAKDQYKVQKYKTLKILENYRIELKITISEYTEAWNYDSLPIKSENTEYHGSDLEKQ